MQRAATFTPLSFRRRCMSGSENRDCLREAREGVLVRDYNLASRPPLHFFLAVMVGARMCASAVEEWVSVVCAVE